LNSCDAVASSLGTGLSPFPRGQLADLATGALVTAVMRNGVRRLVCISALGVGDNRVQRPTYCRTIKPFQPQEKDRLYER